MVQSMVVSAEPRQRLAERAVAEADLQQAPPFHCRPWEVVEEIRVELKYASSKRLSDASEASVMPSVRARFVPHNSSQKAALRSSSAGSPTMETAYSPAPHVYDLRRPMTEVMITGRRLLVVGGAGFVGSNLVRGCWPRSGTILVVDNLLSAEDWNLPADARLAFVEGSIADAACSRRSTDEFDYVFHLATFHGNQTPSRSPSPTTRTTRSRR